jgi:hypothetical protein
MLESGDHIIYRLAMAVRKGRRWQARERGARRQFAVCFVDVSYRGNPSRVTETTCSTHKPFLKVKR